MSKIDDSKTENYYKQRQDRLWNTAEKKRHVEYLKYLDNFNPQGKNWLKWGCYLSERQWGTVRENYGKVGDSWGDCGIRDTFPRDQALHRAYRWGEDGIAGISDDHQFVCFALALWNGSDPCVKERLYGLTNGEGIHGEDVKEYYFYLDNTPSHSYMKYLYKYPYTYPYDSLYQNKGSIAPFEYELVKTGVFADNRYFDVFIEYAKNDVEDILVKITAKNWGNEPKKLHLLPTVWFRKLFKKDDQNRIRKNLKYVDKGNGAIEITQIVDGEELPKMWLYTRGDMKDTLFTDNETDNQEAFGGDASNGGKFYFKNGINNYLLGKYKDGKSEVELAGLKFINPQKEGTKASVHYELDLNPGESKTITLRLSNQNTDQPFEQFDRIFDQRIKEADEFYDAVSPYSRNGDTREKDLYNIQRQALAGMLWNKQLYYFVVHDWRFGDTDPNNPNDPNRTSEDHRKEMSNWNHMYCNDILSMPDKWEYPWFAAWDLAFHTVTLSLIDPQFAKHQLELLVMEWYMHPNGAIPAYEWGFDDINPPVHAWAALKVYEQEKLIYGDADTEFLERIFDKLNMNFTWWVNREDSEGNNIFGGGFLGLDNIRILDLKEYKEKVTLDQADGTAWMAMYCLNMMKMANELKKYDLQRKYLQHFIYIADAFGDKLWDNQAKFFFDRIKGKYSPEQPLDICSLVGLVPLFAIEKIHANMNEAYNMESFYSLNGTLDWFANHKFLEGNSSMNFAFQLVKDENGQSDLEGWITMVNPGQLEEVLKKVLDCQILLSEFGVRSLAAGTNRDFYVDGQKFNIKYKPAEAEDKSIMGGNSNWRGPIWFPINYLLIESLRKFYAYLGDGFTVNYPHSVNPEKRKTLDEVCDDLSNRLISLFGKGKIGKRPVYGVEDLFNQPGFDDYLMFYEYFNGDNGAGLGASHQTGWTGLVANLIQETGVREKLTAQPVSPEAEVVHCKGPELVGATH